MDTLYKDITNYIPINNKKIFCLDTNVLYWYCYPRYSNLISKKRVKEIRPYYDFVDLLVENGNKLVTSIYNVSELLNIIEKHEYEIYQELHQDIEYTLKDMREMPEEREKLKSIMKVALNNVYTTCEVIEFDFSKEMLEKYVDDLVLHRCDVFDYVIINKHMEENRIGLITDDYDFSSIKEIEIFTINSKMLS